MASPTVALQFTGRDRNVANVARKIAGAIGNIGIVAAGVVAGNVIGGFVRQLSSIVPAALDVIGFSERLGMSLETLYARELLATGGAVDMTEALAAAGPKAEELTEWITKLALASPFDRQGLAIAFRTALAYGFAADEAQDLTQIAVDFAAATGGGSQEVDRVTRALGQMQAKGKVSFEELRQLTEAGVPALQILATEFDMAGEELEDAFRDGSITADDAIQAISSSLERDFGGAAARQSETVSGLLNALGDIKELGLEALFKGIAQALLPVVANLSEWLQGPGLERLEAFGVALGEMTKRGIEFGARVVDKIIEFVNFIKTVDLATLAADFLAMFSPEAQSIILGIVDAATNLFNTFRDSLPGLLPIWQSFVDAIGPALMTVLGTLGIDLAAALSALAEIWAKHGETITTGILAAFQFIGFLVGSTVTTIAGLITALFQVLAGDLEGAKETLLLTFGSILSQLLALMSGPMGEIVEAWRATFQVIGLALDAFWKQTKAKFEAWPANFVELGAQLMLGLMEGLQNHAGAVVTTLLNILRGAKTAVLQFFGIGSPSKVFEEIGANLMQGLERGITGTANLPTVALAGVAGAATGSAAGVGGGVGGGASITINLHTDVLDDVAVQRVFDLLDLEARRRGLVLTS